MKTPTEREWTQSDKNWSWGSLDGRPGVMGRMGDVLIGLPYRVVMVVVLVCLLVFGGFVGLGLVFSLFWLYLNIRWGFMVVVGAMVVVGSVFIFLRASMRRSVERHRWMRGEMRRAYGDDYLGSQTTPSEFDY